MIVQIYEIQAPEEAEKCISLGVDHIGSVLVSEDSWRQPLLKEVIGLSQGTDSRNSLIPLFKNQDILYKVLDYYRPAYVHFCDSIPHHPGCRPFMDELIVRQSKLKEEFPEMGVIRSIPIPPKGEAQGFPTLKMGAIFEATSDFFVIDTWLRTPPVGGFIGITGKLADWGLARELVLQSKIPVILAGGLSPENVYEALLRVLPAGADSCTHTNAVDGRKRPIRFKKDFRQVERFVNEVRRAGESIRL